MSLDDLLERHSTQAARNEAEAKAIADRAADRNEVESAGRAIAGSTYAFFDGISPYGTLTVPFDDKAFADAVAAAGDVLARRRPGGLARINQERLAAILETTDPGGIGLRVAIELLEIATTKNRRTLNAAVRKIADAKMWSAVRLAGWQLLWHAIAAEPSLPPPATRHGNAGRDSWFLERAEAGATPAEIRNGWNLLSQPERDSINPANPKKLPEKQDGANVVRAALKRIRGRTRRVREKSRSRQG